MRNAPKRLRKTVNDMTNTFAMYVDVVGECGKTLSDRRKLLDHVGGE